MFCGQGDLPLGHSPIREGSDVIGRFRADARNRLEGPRGCGKDRPRRRESCEQRPETDTAHFFHRPEGDPVFQRFLIHHSIRLFGTYLKP